MTHRTCLTQFAHDSVFVSQNPFFFVCVCTEMDMKRREKDKEANNKRYGQNLKLFPIMNASCERQKQDKCLTSVLINIKNISSSTIYQSIQG